MKREQKRIILPLLDLLQSLPPERMRIFISHLDDKTRDQLYETVMLSLTSSKIPFRKRLFLKTKLAPFRQHLTVLASRRASPSAKKTKLAQIGGAPMKYVLRLAIPVLLGTFRQNKKKKKKD